MCGEELENEERGGSYDRRRREIENKG